MAVGEVGFHDLFGPHHCFIEIALDKMGYRRSRAQLVGGDAVADIGGEVKRRGRERLRADAAQQFQAYDFGALVQLQADNPDENLWPGTFTEVHFHLPANENVVRVPATALIFGEKGIRVATVDEHDAIALKTVQLGQDIGTEVEILAGLGDADRVVDAPLETLGSGDKVRVVSKGGAGPAVVQADRKNRAD